MALKESIVKSQMSEEHKNKLRNIVIGVSASVGLGVGIYFMYKYHAIDRISKLLQSGAVTDQALQEAMTEASEDTYRILKEGTVLHRMESYSDIDITKRTAPSYMAYTKEDVVTYMTSLSDWQGTGERYDTIYESIKDLKIPTKERAKEIFEKLWEEDPKYKEDLRKTMLKCEQDVIAFRAKKQGIELPANYFQDPYIIKSIQKIVDAKLATDPFSVAIRSIVGKEESTKKYVDKLLQAGYDAVEDYADKGRTADDPLILLNPNSSLRKIGEQFVTKQKKLDALNDLMNSGVKYLGAGRIPIPQIALNVRNGS